MADTIATYTKSPNADLDYTIDWTDWLAGDTIATSTWTLPSGITKDHDTSDATSATIWVSGGVVLFSYRLVNHITTAGGRVNDRSIIIDCEYT